MNRLYLILALAGLLFYYGFVIPSNPPLHFFADSVGYLYPPLEAITGGSFSSLYGRSVVYPGFLYVVMTTIGLNELSLVQSLLVACIAIMMSTASVLALKISGFKSNLVGVCAFLLTFLSAVSYQPLHSYAQTVMPEVLYAFFATLVLFAIYSSIYLVGFGDKCRQLIALAFVSGIASSLNLFLKPHWALAFVVTLIAMCFVLARYRIRRRTVLVTALVSFIIPATILWMVNSRFTKNDPVPEAFGSLVLFCVHLDLSLTGYDLLTENTVSNARLREVFAKIVEAGPDGWPLNGINGDSCVYNREVYNLGSRSGPLADLVGVDNLSSFLRKAFVLGVFENPMKYVSKVWKQIHEAVSKPLINYKDSIPGVYSSFSFPELRAKPKQREVLADLKEPVEIARPLHSLPKILLMGDTINRNIDKFALVTNALALLLLVLVAAVGGTRRVGSAGLLLLVTTMVYYSSLSIVAVAHTFDVHRYREAVAPLAILQFVQCLIFVASQLRAGLVRSRGQFECNVRGGSCAPLG